MVNFKFKLAACSPSTAVKLFYWPPKSTAQAAFNVYPVALKPSHVSTPGGPAIIFMVLLLSHIVIMVTNLLHTLGKCRSFLCAVPLLVKDLMINRRGIPKVMFLRRRSQQTPKFRYSNQVNILENNSRGDRG